MTDDLDKQSLKWWITWAFAVRYGYFAPMLPNLDSQDRRFDRIDKGIAE